jgi:hypothetical protein
MRMTVNRPEHRDEPGSEEFSRHVDTATRGGSLEIEGVVTAEANLGSGDWRQSVRAIVSGAEKCVWSRTTRIGWAREAAQRERDRVASLVWSPPATFWLLADAIDAMPDEPGVMVQVRGPDGLLLSAGDLELDPRRRRHPRLVAHADDIERYLEKLRYALAKEGRPERPEWVLFVRSDGTVVARVNVLPDEAGCPGGPAEEAP